MSTEAVRRGPSRSKVQTAAFRNGVLRQAARDQSLTAGEMASEMPARIAAASSSWLEGRPQPGCSA